MSTPREETGQVKMTLGDLKNSFAMVEAERRRPKLVRLLCNMPCFIIIYAAGLFFYGMSVSITNSNIVSIERRFGFNTKTMGIILAGNEIGHIVTALAVAHFGGGRNRPLWVCFGTVLMGLSMLLFAGPEVFFHRDKPPSGNRDTEFFCHARQLTSSFLTSNSTAEQECSEGARSNSGAVIIMLISHILVGFGSTTPMVLGMPYVDDNADTSMLSIYYGIALFGRLTGPLAGFGIGAITTSYYVDFSTPPFAPNDPRWISAWYIGFIVAGVGLTLFGILIGFFPPELPRRHLNPSSSSTTHLTTAENGGDSMTVSENAGKAVEASKVAETQSHSPFSAASWMKLLVDLKRLLTNLAFICRTTSMFVDGMIVAGIFNFLPKYYAQQFSISQSMAAIYAGLILVVGVIIGLVLGSLVIKKFNLQPRHVGLLLVVPSLLLAIGLFASIGFGCPQTEIYGMPSVTEFRENYNAPFRTSPCATGKGCDCSLERFNPVCDTVTNTNYYSPCYAGCNQVFSPNKTRAKFYQGCTCLKDTFSPTNSSIPTGNAGVATRVAAGLCKKDCSSALYGLTALLFVSVLGEGIPFPGQVMIQFRVVDPDLKNLCAGVTSLLVNAFGLLPAPIFIGAIVDSACRLWQRRPCGALGACLLYDTEDFRWKFFLTAGCLKLINVVTDGIVTWKVWNWKFDRTEEDAVTTTSETEAKKEERF